MAENSDKKEPKKAKRKERRALVPITKGMGLMKRRDLLKVARKIGVQVTPYGFVDEEDLARIRAAAGIPEPKGLPNPTKARRYNLPEPQRQWVTFTGAGLPYRNRRKH